MHRRLLALAATATSADRIEAIFADHELQVVRPEPGEAPLGALQRTATAIDACIVCGDHPDTLLARVAAAADDALVPVVLCGCSLAVDETKRLARELLVPWVHLAGDADAIAAEVGRAIAGTDDG